MHPTSKKTPPSTLGSTSNHENSLFSVKPLITLTCRSSLIGPASSKFYFGILIRVANETGCESLIDEQGQNLIIGANILNFEKEL